MRMDHHQLLNDNHEEETSLSMQRNEQEEEEEEERRTRIMELAQQQQMALQLLDTVVENRQRRNNNNNGGLRRRRVIRIGRQLNHDNDNMNEEEDDRGGVDGEDAQWTLRQLQRQQHQQWPTGGNHPPHQPHQHQHEGGNTTTTRSSPFFITMTQLYLICTVLFAFLAVVTTTSTTAAIDITTKTIITNRFGDDVSTMSSTDMTAAATTIATIKNNNDGHHHQDEVNEMETYYHDKYLLPSHRNGGNNGHHEYYTNDYQYSSNRVVDEREEERWDEKKRRSSSTSPPTPPATTTSWTATINKAYQHIRTHYHVQYLVLQHFWRYGTLLDVDDLPYPYQRQHQHHQGRGQQEVDQDEDARDNNQSAFWSMFQTWKRHTLLRRNRFDTRGGSSSSSSVSSSSRRNGGGRKKKKGNAFSLYRVAMSVIDPSPRLQDVGSLDGKMAPTEDDYSNSNSNSNKDSASMSSLQINEDEGERHETSKPSSSSSHLAQQIISSTPRLMAIANLILALVYLFHAAIADLFLGTSSSSSNNSTWNNPFRAVGQQQQGRQRRQRGNNTTVDEQPTLPHRRSGRERLGAYLCFKLLLISSVLDPDTEDLLILFAWYLILSFLRSLAHLAGATTQHAAQSGLSPQPGALRLLIVVLLCDAAAATGCIVLFRGLGWHMLLLLTCDCALVGADAMAHIVKHVGSTIEERHRSQITSLEEEVSMLRRRGRERREQYRDELLGSEEETAESDFDISLLPIGQRLELEHLDTEVTRLEQDVEQREVIHTRRMKIAEGIIFWVEVFVLVLTMGHFMHIWACHGASFGLVDFVLALHLHSTISVLGKKISDRRSIYRVDNQLNSNFVDASDLDIRKASVAGDVCCICLNSMTVGNVKKVGCGHLFHTQCLREVVERERSIHAAKCPLCRANLITGRHDRPMSMNNTNEAGQVVAQTTAQQNNNPQLNTVDTSLLRFSTEEWLPSWLPIPAFSFEVVRRETPVIDRERNPNPGGWQRFFRRGGQVEANDVNGAQQDDDNNVQVQPQGQQQQQQQQGTSFWRRLLILLGAIPMSPEEEAIALEQLVDMFPQYERIDLLNELRARRSAEAVVESVLLGVFSGVPRGGG